METGPWGLCKEVVVNFVVLHCCGEGSDIYIYMIVLDGEGVLAMLTIKHQSRLPTLLLLTSTDVDIHRWPTL